MHGGHLEGGKNGMPDGIVLFSQLVLLSFFSKIEATRFFQTNNGIFVWEGGQGEPEVGASWPDGGIPSRFLTRNPQATLSYLHDAVFPICGLGGRGVGKGMVY